MSCSRTMVLAFVLAGIAAGAGAQTGDPERTRQQEALAHAVVIQTAWRSVQERIRVTDAANLWENEWSGLTAPPSSRWWLSSWTGRGLTARYCAGVLAVYATSDELKGVQRDHREVQVAPARYGDGRTGLHIILANSRIAVGAHGRDDEALPLCMAIPSATGDRVGLVSAVADPIRTVTGFRWNTETRDVPCVNSPSDSIREARRMPIQLTSVRGAGETRGRDLAVTDPGNLDIWPSDCGLRAGLGPQAQCTDWKRVGGGCPHIFAQAAPPTPIPDPVITCSAAPVYRTTGSCGCGSGYTGTCTLRYEQAAWYRDFQVRPNAPRVRTRRLQCVDSNGTAFGPGTRTLVAREEDCRPIDVDGGNDGGGDDPGGPDGGGPGGGGPDAEAPAEDDSATEGFGSGPGAVGPPGSDGVSTNGGGGDGGGCFLTTAVVERRGGADDGPTLTALRQFRDRYMLAAPDRIAMVAEYYAVAPKIVAAMPADHSDWDWIEERIDAAVAAIRAGNDADAFTIYVDAMRRLNDRWLVEGAGE